MKWFTVSPQGISPWVKVTQDGDQRAMRFMNQPLVPLSDELLEAKPDIKELTDEDIGRDDNRKMIIKPRDPNNELKDLALVVVQSAEVLDSASVHGVINGVKGDEKIGLRDYVATGNLKTLGFKEAWLFCRLEPGDTLEIVTSGLQRVEGTGFWFPFLGWIFEPKYEAVPVTLATYHYDGEELTKVENTEAE